MVVVFRRRRAAPEPSPAARHLIVVAGSLDEWADLSEDGWSERLNRLGSAAARAGVESLRIVPTSGGRPVEQRRTDVDGCRVVADPRPDGRANLVEAVNSLGTASEVSEATIQRALGADDDVDLVIVVGQPDIVPQALVWELAYAELVYIDATWESLTSEHVLRSIDEFAVRQRRFGGVVE